MSEEEGMGLVGLVGMFQRKGGGSYEGEGPLTLSGPNLKRLFRGSTEIT